jgi:hypothetical protein
LPASDLRSATEKGRTMSVKEASALARVAEPAPDTAWGIPSKVKANPRADL